MAQIQMNGSDLLITINALHLLMPATKQTMWFAGHRKSNGFMAKQNVLLCRAKAKPLLGYNEALLLLGLSKVPVHKKECA